jgi:hypothetical protein
MTSKISRVRKVPQFPHQKGIGIAAFFQLIIGILLWIFAILLFAIGAWAAWFGMSLSYLFGKTHNIIPWWFSWMCVLLVFPLPFTALVVLIAEFAKILNKK